MYIIYFILEKFLFENETLLSTSGNLTIYQRLISKLVNKLFEAKAQP